MGSEDPNLENDSPAGNAPLNEGPLDRGPVPDPGGAPEAASEEADDFDVAAFFAAGASSPGAVTASTPASGPSAGSSAGGTPGGARARGSGTPKAPAPDTSPLDLPELSRAPGAVGDPDHMDLLSDVDLNVTIELGRTRMLVEDVLRLAQGSVVELDKLAGDPVDVYVNERLVAKGEVLVLNDNFCVRINELVSEEVRRSA